MNMPDLSDSNVRTLQTFCRLVSDLAEARLIKTLLSRERIHLKMGTDAAGRPAYSGDLVDWDDFRSFLTLFRQLIAPKEPAYLPRVLKSISLRISLDDAKGLRQTRKELVSLIDSPTNHIQIGYPTADGPVFLSTKQLVDVVLNGAVFHGDAEHQTVWDAIKDSKPLIAANLLGYSAPILQMAFFYRDRIATHSLIPGVVRLSDSRLWHSVQTDSE